MYTSDPSYWLNVVAKQTTFVIHWIDIENYWMLEDIPPGDLISVSFCLWSTS